MIQLDTIGVNFFPQCSIALKVYKDLKEIPIVPLHTTYMIIIVEEGTGILNMNGSRFMLQAPEVYCINELENVAMEKGHNLKIHIIYFHPRIIDLEFDFEFIREKSRADVTDSQVQDLFWLNPFLSREGSMTVHYCLNQIMLRRLLQLMDCVVDEFENQSSYFWICRGRSFFLEIICYLSKLQTAIPSDLNMMITPQTEVIEDILLYIHTNYTKKITLQQLVDQFHMNRTSMNELFRRVTGDTVIAYIIKLRIDLSASLLRDTGITIKEIGDRVGYEDVVNFTRTFKKLKGCSPKKYREDHSWLLRMC